MLRGHFSEVISMLAVSDTEEELTEILEGFIVAANKKGWMKDFYARHILIKELVQGAKSISGTGRNNICWFYNKMELELDTINRLKNKNWHIKAGAIQVLSYLDQKKHITKIYRFTNNKNELVSHEARMAVVKLTGFQGLRFLDIISYPISEWQQLHLMHELSKKDKTDLKDIGRWLQSKNDSVAEFALRLVEVYQVHELHDGAALLLHHPNNSVKLKAILALRQIHNDKTAALMIKEFEGYSTEVQFSILTCLQETGTEKEIAFLATYLSHARDDFKMAAARAIRSINKQGVYIIEQAIDKSNGPWPVLLPQLLQEETE